MATSRDEFDPGDLAVSQVMREAVHPAVNLLVRRYPRLAPRAFALAVWVRDRLRQVTIEGSVPVQSAEEPLVQVHLRFRKTFDPTRVQYAFRTAQRNPLVTLASDWCGVCGRGRGVLHDFAGFAQLTSSFTSQESFWGGTDERATLWFSGGIP